MKKRALLALLFFAALAALPPDAQSQNMTTVSAANITDASGNKLPAGKVLFQPTDSRGNHIPIQIGGGGMIVDYQACALVVTGAITTQCPPNGGTFQVANPAATLPSGIYYQVVIQDGFGSVRTIPNVTWSGATFNLDNFIPATGSVPVATASSIDHLQVGQLDVFRNLLLYGTCTGCLGGSVMVNNTLMASPFAALNLANGAGITVTDAGSGKAQFALAAPTTLILGGVKSLACSAGSHLSGIDTAGQPACTADSGGVTLNHNGSANSSQTTLNLKDGTGSTVTNPANGDVQVNVTYGSGANTAAAGNDSRIVNAAQVNAANTFTAGSKQTVQANATTAGLNFAGVSADPSALANGDAWHRSDLFHLYTRLNGVTRQFAMTNDNITGTAAGLSAILGCAQFPTITGDSSTPGGNCVMTNTKVNGVAYASAPATNTVPVITAANVATYTALSDCLDVSGNHLNFDATAHTFSCGTSSSGGGGGGVPPGSALGLGMTRVSSTEFDVGAECTNSTPCNVATPTGPVTFNSGNAPAKIILSGSATAGTARIDVASGTGSQPGIGTITVYYDAGASNITTCTNCTAATASLFPNYGEAVIGTLVSSGSPATWPATPTQDLRGGMSMFFVLPGTGINISGAGNNVIGLATPVTTASGGTNVTSSGAAGQYLRSNGADWVSSALLAGDLPSVPPIASIPVDSGAVNAYVIAPSPAFSSLANGDIAYFVTATANTGASTINVNGLGVKNITKKGATALVTGDILAGSPKAIYKIVYDGTEWQLINPSTSGGAGTVTSFSAGNLSPLFTTSVATATTTPALTFSLSSFAAQAVLAGPSAYGASATAPTARVLVPQDLPAGTLSCGVLDTAICSSAVDANGRPNFLSGSGAAITVNGGTTPLTYFVGGIYQQINANISVTCATPAATTLMFIYVQADTAVANPAAGDLFCASNAPFTQKAAPTCPSPSPSLSASNPSVWWNLAKNETDTCTANAGSYAKATQPMILLGVAVVTSTPTTTDVLAEPYLLNPVTRFKMFGSGAQGSLSLTSGTTTKDGVQMYQSVMLNGATLNHTAPTTASNSPGLILVSQTPIIIDNTSSLTAAGKGGALTNGGTGAGSTGKTGGFFSGGGGGGGGGTGNAGGTGGGRQSFIGTTAVGGGGGGASGSGVGNAGTAADTGQGHPAFNNCLNVVMGIGAGGASGGGDGTNGGGGGKEGGGAICVQAPAVLLASGSTFSCAGNNASNGAGGNTGGGGGGGGGVCIINTSNLQIAGTVTAAGGTHGNAVGTGGNGGDGGAGIAQQNELW